jgi:predicted lactoylglutathione lyase
MTANDGMRTGLNTILPCNDLDASEAFYNRLGFFQPEASKGKYPEYRMLTDNKGGDIHLTPAVEGWLIPGRNPFGLYFYTDRVDELAEIFGDEIIERSKRPEHKEWGMYEFALSDPDDTLVRIGWPSRLIQEASTGRLND